MAILLDGRTSQNASYANSIGVATSSSFQTFGSVGLNISQADANTIIRVQFDGVITLR
jgi:hypothetical protein